MPRRRLARLERLERIRKVSAIEAARRSAEAESGYARLQALAEKSRNLAADYAARGVGLDAWELQQARAFSSELDRISRDTQHHAHGARQLADTSRAELANAKRRREQVEERLKSARRQIASQIGTGLEMQGGKTRKPDSEPE